MDNMVQYTPLIDKLDHCKRLASELCGPIDSVNRFINLTLENTDENSQNREFLLESKEGIRKVLELIKRLDTYTKEIERELSEFTAYSEKNKCIDGEQR